MFDQRGKIRSFGAVIIHYRVVAKLDARLHHNADHPLPGIVQIARVKRFLSDFDGRAGILGRGDRQIAERFLRTAGNRHFGSDDVNGRHIASCGFAKRFFTDLAQFCGAFRDSFRRQRRMRTAGIVRTAHARIEMNFPVTGRHVRGNLVAGFAHRRCGGLALPDVRTKVVTAKNQAIGG